jgi:hypothetical protein
MAAELADYAFGSIRPTGYNTNVFGAILTMQEAIKHFAPEGGAIINIATAGVSSTLPMSSLGMRWHGPSSAPRSTTANRRS